MKVLAIRERKDGGADIDILISNKEKKIIAKAYNKKRFSKKLLIKMINEHVDKMYTRFLKKGYKMKFDLIPKEKSRGSRKRRK